MYWLHLSKQYMQKNKARTLYSICGIVLTFILCFSIMTAWYSAWDYTYLTAYEQMPYELYFYDQIEGGVSEEFIRQTQRLENYPNTDKLTVRNYYGNVVFTSQMKRGEQYQMTLKLKDTSDLYGTAASIEEQTGIKFAVRGDVAQYLHQGESAQDSLMDFLIMLIASIFGLFSAAILRNTMLISVSERVRDYGLLRCVGMSKRQLRFLLFTEGAVLCLIASVFGIGLGYLGLQCLTPWLRKTLQLERIFRFRFYWKAAGYTTLLCIGVTLFSLVEPSRQAGLVSPRAALQGDMGGNLGLPKKWKKKKGGKLWEKLFGVSGMYAYRNMKRSKGRGGSVFFAMFFSITFLMTMLSFSDSLEATMRDGIGEIKAEYRESINCRGSEIMYTAGDTEYAAVEELEAKEDVEDATIWMECFDNTNNPFSFFGHDPYLKTLADYERVRTIQHLSYEKALLERLSPYLLEGSIDYDRMVAENGILIWDNDVVSQRRGNTGNGSPVRLTNYQVGDTITVLSVEGRTRAKDVYLAAAREVAERNGLNYIHDEKGRPVKVPWDADPQAECITTMTRGAGDDQKAEFDRLQEEMFNAMEKQGYDCRAYFEEAPISMIKLLEAAQNIEYEKGSVTVYKIFGILSEDPLVGGHAAGFYPNCIEVVWPTATAERLVEEVNAKSAADEKKQEYTEAPVMQYYFYAMTWRTMIGVKRVFEDDFPDDELRRYAEARKWEYEDLIGSKYGEDYKDDLRILRVMRVSVWLLSSFIILVCMIQIINTLQANMRLRRKELWLYDVVGMEPKQKFQMLLIEHGLSAIFAMLGGMAVSFAFSYWMLEMMLDVNDTQIFIWPVGKALLIGSMITALILGVNLLEIRRADQQNERVHS